jgi:hypothetical protein
MKVLNRPKAFEARDLAALNGVNRDSTRWRSLAVDEDLARAALFQTTAELGPFQAQVVTQDIEQWRIGLDGHAIDAAINSELDFAALMPPFARLSARCR